MLKTTDKEGQLFKSKLSNIINLNHPLCKLEEKIAWTSLEETFKNLYNLEKGRPGNPIRLMVTLHYFKNKYDLSDERVLDMWLENPYWQYLSGMKYFQIDLPLDPSTMVRFRKRLCAKKMEKLFDVVISSGLRSTAVKLDENGNIELDKSLLEKIKEGIRGIFD